MLIYRYMNQRKKFLYFMIMTLVFLPTQIAFAVPPDGQYGPGDTLNPNCAPGSANCTVNIPDSFLEQSDTLGGTEASYTAGSILFTSSSAVAEDNSNIFWDDVNNFLGIKDSTPSYELDIEGIVDSTVSKTRSIMLPGSNLIQGIAGFSKHVNIDGGLSLKGKIIFDQFGRLRRNTNIKTGGIESEITGTFATSESFSAGYDGTTSSAQTQNIYSFDVNNDLYDDIIVINTDTESVEVYLSDGDGTFASIADYTPDISNFDMYAVAPGDFNGDGWLDMVVTELVNSSGRYGIMYNNGDGTFNETVVTYTVDPNYSAWGGVEAGDMNNDGLLDVVMGSSFFAVRVAIQNSDGTFQDTTGHTAHYYPSDVKIADFNGDGWNDFVVSTDTSNGYIYVFLNDGDGTFPASGTVYSASANPDIHSLYVNDIDLDGDIDIVAGLQYPTDGVSDPGFHVFSNDGDGTFTGLTYDNGVNCLCSNVISWDIVAEDINGDAYPDVILNLLTDGGGVDGFSVFINDGDGTYTFDQTYTATGGDPGSFAMGYFNEDDLLDLALNQPFSTTVKIYENQSSPLFKTDTINGRVGIGTSTPDTLFHVEQSGTGAIATFTDGNSETSCTVDGTAFSCSSDERLKKNFKQLDGILGKVLQLTPVKYVWRNEKEGDLEKIGFKAQEIKGFFPELIGSTPNGYLTMNYAGLTPILTKAIQEMYQEFNSYAPLGQYSADSQITAFLGGVQQKTINGVSKLKEVFADVISSKTVYVRDELCFDDICINKEQFRDLLEKNEIEYKRKGVLLSEGVVDGNEITLEEELEDVDIIQEEEEDEFLGENNVSEDPVDLEEETETEIETEISEEESLEVQEEVLGVNEEDSVEINTDASTESLSEEVVKEDVYVEIDSTTEQKGISETVEG
jgi:hypothetical protein